MRDEQRDVQSRVMSDISVFLSVEQEQTAAAFRELHIFIVFTVFDPFYVPVWIQNLSHEDTEQFWSLTVKQNCSIMLNS